MSTHDKWLRIAATLAALASLVIAFMHDTGHEQNKFLLLAVFNAIWANSQREPTP